MLMVWTSTCPNVQFNRICMIWKMIHLTWRHQYYYYRVSQKKWDWTNFIFVISQLNIHPIFKILVSTPHKYGVIMGSRHTNFEDWMNIDLLNYENKICSVSFFLGHPVTDVCYCSFEICSRMTNFTIQIRTVTGSDKQTKYNHVV